MPIYEYRCQKCHKTFEHFKRGVNDNVQSCPHCQSKKFEQILSVTSPAQMDGGLNTCSEGSCPSTAMPGCGGGKCPF